MKLASKALLLGATVITLMPSLAWAGQTRDLNDRIVVDGLTAYGKYEARIDNQPVTNNVSANNCGIIRIAPSAARPINAGDSLTINGTTVAYNTLSIGATPACSNGTLNNAAELPTGSWKDSNGNIYTRNLTPYNPYTVVYNNLPTTRNLSANACGHATLPAGVTGSVTISDRDTSAIVASFNASALTATLATPICRNGISYSPDGGGGGGGGGS